MRLIRAVAVETQENWLEATRYLNMEHLRERKKELLAKRLSPMLSFPDQLNGSAVLAPSRSVASGSTLPAAARGASSDIQVETVNLEL